jgi:neutral/alkaline ceramidase-like enzyme
MSVQPLQKRSILQGLALALLIGPVFGAEQIGPLRAGAAKIDITPPKGMFPIRGNQVLVGVHDPLYARALVFDNGVSKAALISVDTAGMPNSADIVKAVTGELGIPASYLSVAATHDHNTPTFGGGGRRTSYDPAPYLAFMQKGIVEAARQANAHLQPARIGFGTGKAYINTNRDQKIGDSYKMGYAPDGPSDKTVAVILVTTLSGDPIAVWSNYAVHGVVMFLSKTRDGQAEVTGDIGGATANYVEDQLKNNVVAVWTSGAAGDQNPLFMSTYNQDAPDVHDEGAAGWGILDVQSRRLGEEIVRVARNIQNTADRVVLWGANTSVTCPGRKRESSEPGPTVAGSFTPASSAARMVDGDPVTIPLGLMMINDIALANVSGEVFTEIAQKLRHESLFDRTAMVTLSGGSIGYIPSEKAYLLPSAMAANNRIKPGCAEQALVGAFVELEKQYLPIWKALY